MPFQFSTDTMRVLIVLCVVCFMTGFSGALGHRVNERNGNRIEEKWRNETMEKRDREGKFFSFFTVITFNNDPCKATTGENGTCYKANECTARGGTGSGSCAQGFGTCCIFTVGCGATTSQNGTYFQNPGYVSTYDATGSCQLTVNKASSNVCQLRLDFETLVLQAPETTDHTCNRDQMIVTGGSRVPAICGVNTGNHMYVDTDLTTSSPITITIVTSGTSFARSWRIKISQIPCDSIYRADGNCLQYYTGVAGTIRTYNYDTTTATNSRQLSNQDYTICIRTERNFCSVIYSVCTGGVFSIGGSTTAGQSGVGSAGCLTDWITVPCASDNGRSTQSSGSLSCVDRICGDAFSSLTAATTPIPVYSTVRPFRMVVHFDATEANTATSTTFSRGFCLSYVQQPCTS